MRIYDWELPKCLPLNYNENIRKQYAISVNVYINSGEIQKNVPNDTTNYRRASFGDKAW